MSTTTKSTKATVASATKSSTVASATAMASATGHHALPPWRVPIDVRVMMIGWMVPGQLINGMPERDRHRF